ncbi:COPI associated protein-domain-containing protein [Cunninghamella echinulata]|nr:COPI associated protein-domain-containing protein [Cunninghamella echinulata]
MPENLSFIFRIINIVTAAFMIIGSVSLILQGYFPRIILAIICIIFGAITIVFEFKLPGQITQFASIMFSFLGRGLFYLFIGCILLNNAPLSIACGVIIIVVAIIYIVLHFIPSIEPPKNMQMSAFEESIGLLRHHHQHQYNPPTSTPPFTTPSTPINNYHPSASPMYSSTPSSPHPPPIPQETTPYPQKTYIPNEAHIV